jgi:hypothetical protein
LHLFEHPEDYRAYLERAENWLSLIVSDTNTRLKILDKIFSDKTWSKQALDSANGIILLVEGLARDLLLLSFGQPERLQHSALLPALEKTLAWLEGESSAGSLPLIFRQLKLAAQAKEYLAANVNPHLVLEQIVINI